MKPNKNQDKFESFKYKSENWIKLRKVKFIIRESKVHEIEVNS